MDESTDLIGMIDYAKIFDDSCEEHSMKRRILPQKQARKIRTPLLGYALGFPRVKSVEGRDFITRTVATDPWEKSNEELKQIIESHELDDAFDSLTREEMIDLVSEFYNET